jgi:geranylgeranyl pyrophosphate synthase
VDDVLDFQGDEDRLGKPVANDLRQGIATLPVMLFNQKQPQHPAILKAIRRDPVKNDEILAVVEQIRASGSVSAALKEARQLARQAQAALERLPDNPYRRAMAGLADYTVDRDI